MRKRDIALELVLEKIIMFYYIFYYIIGVKLEILPSIRSIGDLNFTETHVVMLPVYLIVVILSQVVTYAGVDLFTKEEGWEI